MIRRSTALALVLLVALLPFLLAQTKSDGMRIADSNGFAVTSTNNALDVNVKSAGDPCTGAAKTAKVLSTTANAVLITGISGKLTYLCSYNVVAAAATNVAIVEGTGSTCGTNTIGTNSSGGATAAAGWNFAANGGIAQGTGGGTVAQTTVAGDDLCILVSAANQISGGLSYVQK